jgi:hypothetical protein
MSDEATDEMYLKLKGIRDRACRLQVLVQHQSHRDDLQTVADIADRLGIFYSPAQWSNFDLPTSPLDEQFDYGPQFGESEEP